MARATWRRRADGVHVIVRRGRASAALAAILTMLAALAVVGVLSAALTASLALVPFAVVAGLAALAFRAARSRPATAEARVAVRPRRPAAVLPFPASARPPARDGPRTPGTAA